MDYSSSDGNQGKSDGLKNNFRGRSRRRSRRKNRPQNENRHTSFNKAGKERDTYKLPGFPTSKDLQKPRERVVGPEFFSDLKATPDQPLIGDSQAEHLTCCYCRQPIEEMSLAVDVPDSDSPAHFDCVIERLKSSENLQPGESVIYMGNRRFAVVVYTDKNRFDIVREIPFEDTRDFKPWRNAFSVKMRKQLE